MISNFATEMLAGTVVAALSGIAGAAYQLHRRRSRPFVLITHFSGDAFATNERVDIAQDVRARLQRSLILIDLDAQAPLSRVHDIWRVATDISKRGPELSSRLVQAVKSLRSARTDEEILEAILPPLWMTLFDRFITTGLKSGRLKMAAPQPQGEAKVKVYYESSMHGGCFNFDFPSGAIYFGSDLEDSVLDKDKLSGFVDIVKVLDRDCLTRALSELVKVLDEEISIAESVKVVSRNL